jgi:hypothetical protein
MRFTAIQAKPLKKVKKRIAKPLNRMIYKRKELFYTALFCHASHPRGFPLQKGLRRGNEKELYKTALFFYKSCGFYVVSHTGETAEKSEETDCKTFKPHDL